MIVELRSCGVADPEIVGLRNGKVRVTGPGSCPRPQRMPAAAQGRFGSAGERPRHFRQYNVSADTGAIEMRSRWARPRCSASKYDGLAEAPARTGRTVRARALVSCAGLGVLVLVPVPSRAGSLACACNTTLLAGWIMYA